MECYDYWQTVLLGYHDAQLTVREGLCAHDCLHHTLSFTHSLVFNTLSSSLDLVNVLF